jgi:transposase
MGSEAVWICVGEHMSEEPVRVFGTTTAQLVESAGWMRSLGVDTVAMEATGVYWVAAYEIYEEYGLRPILINSQSIRGFNGMKKSDFIDCQWIQLLHTFGILQPSARAEKSMIELRGYMRQRKTLTEQCSELIQRMQKALTLMNVRLDQAVSDVTGVTGMSIMRAIIKGERDAAKLAMLRDEGCAKTELQIAEALTGHWRDEQLFVLEQTVELWDFCQTLMVKCDQKSEAVLRTLPVRTEVEEKKSKAKRRKNQVSFDGQSLLHERLGVDLTLIKGLQVLTILTVISECGIDLSRFPTAKHFVSWLGLAPGTKKSGNRVLSSRSRRTTNRAATALRLAAQSLLKSEHSELGAFGRSLRARIGAEKAITAVAAKLARRIYLSLQTGRVYQDRGATYHDQQDRDRKIASLHKRARRLGMQVIPMEASA